MTPDTGQVELTAAGAACAYHALIRRAKECREYAQQTGRRAYEAEADICAEAAKAIRLQHPAGLGDAARDRAIEEGAGSLPLPVPSDPAYLEG